jgi:NADPH-dependent 2,4-dienoyl-CoA reductase/sulfur reductase-like enzyme
VSERKFEFDVVVIGGGPGGLAAACAAAECGARVGLVEESPWLGGQIWRGQETRCESPVARQWLLRLHEAGVKVLDQTAIFAMAQPGLLLGEHAQGARQIGFQKLVLATGARELFLPFPGWTLPGVMGAGGLQALVKQGWPVAGKRVVVAGSGPLLLAVADGLKKHGAKVVCVAEQAPFSRVSRFGLGMLRYPSKLLQGLGIKLRLVGVPYSCGVWPVEASGDKQVQRVVLTDGRRKWTEECDLLACGFGLAPNVELPLALGCRLADGFVEVDAWQAAKGNSIYAVGELTGIGGADAALAEGQIAGYAAAGRRDQVEPLVHERAVWHEFRRLLAESFALRDEVKALASPETILCRCEDVLMKEARLFSGWREAKLHTRCGMGACQGRTCGAAAKAILGWSPESIRPPVIPARVESLISNL